ncbi:anti-repressor Ant [Vibrio phage D137]|nr:putative DNA-binding protein [Vibrio phage 252E42.2]
MNIQTLSQSKTLTMSSREIAKVVQSRHDNVKRTMERLEGKSLIQLTPMEEVNEKGQSVEVYHVNEEHSYIVVAQLSPEFTAAIVRRWRELEEQSKPLLPNFANPAEAARAWAEQYELNVLASKQLEEAKPKVEFHDKLVNDAANFSLRDAAKKIQQRPNKFAQWLRDKGYLCQNNMAKQQYLNQGLFKTHTDATKDGYQFNQARMTSKGLSYFTKKLGEIKL